MALSKGPLKKIIAIDPGHGGRDNGITGPGKTKEKNITLDLSRLLAKELEKNYAPFLTRTDDTNPPLFQRVSMANNAKASLFISLHLGGSFIPNSDGITIYHLKPAKEPAPADGNEGWKTFLEDIKTWDEVQAQHLEMSKKLAGILQKNIRKKMRSQTIRVRSAPLLVLKGANMPAVLIEIGHLTNPTREKMLGKKEHLKNLTRGITRGIKEFLAQK